MNTKNKIKNMKQGKEVAYIPISLKNNKKSILISVLLLFLLTTSSFSIISAKSNNHPSNEMEFDSSTEIITPIQSQEKDEMIFCKKDKKLVEVYNEVGDRIGSRSLAPYLKGYAIVSLNNDHGYSSNFAVCKDSYLPYSWTRYFFMRPNGKGYCNGLILSQFNNIYDKISAGDINGNGFDELLIGSLTSDRIYVWSHQKFLFDISMSIDFTKNDCIASGDIDNDGKDEFIIASQNTGCVTMLEENGDFINDFDVEFSQMDCLECADVDGDGIAEIIVADESLDEVRIYNMRTGLKYNWFTNVDTFGALCVGDIYGNDQNVVIIGHLSGIVTFHNYMNGNEIDQIYLGEPVLNIIFSVGDIIHQTESHNVKKGTTNILVNNIFERFPNMFPILR